MLATGAMVVRNGVILLVVAPAALRAGCAAIAWMAATAAAFALWRRRAGGDRHDVPSLPLQSPFSLSSALRFGLIFLVLQIAGTLAQRALGEVGFYAVSLVGGMISSASAVASAGAVSASGQVSPHVAATGAVLATIVSAAVNLPLVARVSGDRRLTLRVAVPIATITCGGIAGLCAQRIVDALVH